MSLLSEACLREALQSHARADWPALPGRTNHRRAGVLLPLIWSPDPQCLVTLRPPYLRRHASEIAFPGGRPEPDDVDLEATARREAREEVGIEHARVLGRLSSTPLYTSDFRLEPFVAAVSDGPFTLDPVEVAELFRLPLLDLLDRPSLHGIAWDSDGHHGVSPVFEVGPHVMYGATAHVFLELLQVAARALGQTVPPMETGRYAWSDLVAFRES